MKNWALQPVVKEGLAAQVNSLGTITSIDCNSFTDLLMDTLSNTTGKPNNYNTLYLGSDTYDMFWEIVYKDRGIKLYGAKCIKAKKDSFTYEAVVFDEFPKDKESYSICIEDTEEEVLIHMISDTCIRFVLSKRWPDGDEFKLTWD